MDTYIQEELPIFAVERTCTHRSSKDPVDFFDLPQKIYHTTLLEHGWSPRDISEHLIIPRKTEFTTTGKPRSKTREILDILDAHPYLNDAMHGAYQRKYPSSIATKANLQLVRWHYLSWVLIGPHHQVHNGHLSRHKPAFAKNPRYFVITRKQRINATQSIGYPVILSIAPTPIIPVNLEDSVEGTAFGFIYPHDLTKTVHPIEAASINHLGSTQCLKSNGQYHLTRNLAAPDGFRIERP